jgi:hypothetical protein
LIILFQNAVIGFENLGKQKSIHAAGLSILNHKRNHKTVTLSDFKGRNKSFNKGNIKKTRS